MKEFIKENLFVVIATSILLLLGVIVVLDSRNSEIKPMGATVIEHNVTADKYGNRTYTTIIKTDDGFIEEKTGLNIYTVPVGHRVVVEVKRYKKK